MISKGITIEKSNGNNTYSSVYPKVTKSQIIGWDTGEIHVAEFNLNYDDWNYNMQTVQILGLEETDIVFCNKILNAESFNPEMSFAEKLKQYQEYNKIISITSGHNIVTINCSSPLEVEVRLQIWWFK